MYSEDDFVMLSALQHLLFCERQCWLIHGEQTWGENRFTTEGNIMHERVDDPAIVTYQTDVRIERAVLLKSSLLGLSGKADVVEFHRCQDGQWMPFPVEYKRGKPKPDDCDKVQLCAQAFCLEEMLNVSIPAGALFYGKTQHRLIVDFDRQLRDVTQAACLKLHKLLSGTVPPPPVYVSEKCDPCSLIDFCLPKTVVSRSALKYLNSVLENV